MSTVWAYNNYIYPQYLIRDVNWVPGTWVPKKLPDPG